MLLNVLYLFLNILQLTEEIARATEFLLLYISEGQYKSLCMGDGASQFTKRHSVTENWKNMKNTTSDLTPKYRCKHCAYSTDYLQNMTTHHTVHYITLHYVHYLHSAKSDPFRSASCLGVIYLGVKIQKYDV